MMMTLMPPPLPLLWRVFARRLRQEPRRPLLFYWVMLSFEGRKGRDLAEDSTFARCRRALLSRAAAGIS
jgi:hypothetical protein